MAETGPGRKIGRREVAFAGPRGELRAWDPEQKIDADDDAGEAPVPTRPVSRADRRAMLQGLAPQSRRLATALLAAHDWPAASLPTIRSYALAVARLQALENDAAASSTELARAVRVTVALARQLGLGGR